MLTFRPLLTVLPLLVTLVPLGSAASPDAYADCRDLAATTAELRKCGTFRQDVAACDTLRAGGGVDAPAACLVERRDAWLEALEREEALAEQVGAPAAEEGRAAWTAKVARQCRDAEEIRISAQRFGQPFADFEAARCELRNVIRRLVSTSVRVKGF